MKKTGLFFCFLLLAYVADAQSTRKTKYADRTELKIDLSKIPKDGEILDPDTLRFQFHSQKTGFKLDTNSNIGLYKQAYNWLGTPYRFGGSTKKGIDCSAFTNMMYAEAYGVDLPRDSRSIYKQVKPIAKSELKEGDLVFFRISRGQISHVGVYLGDNKFIHASTTRGVIISNLDEDYYRRYYYKAGRFTGQEIQATEEPVEEETEKK